MRIHKLAAAALLGVAALGIVRLRNQPSDQGHALLGAIPQGQSFYVVPANGIQPGLEFNRYAALVAQQMAARGYTPGRQAPPRPTCWSRSATASTKARQEYSVDPFAQSRYYSPFYRGFYDPFYGGYFGRPYCSRFGYYGYRSPFYWGWDDPFWYNSPYSGFGRRPDPRLHGLQEPARPRHRSPRRQRAVVRRQGRRAFADRRARHSGSEPDRGDVHQLPGRKRQDGEDHGPGPEKGLSRFHVRKNEGPSGKSGRAFSSSAGGGAPALPTQPAPHAGYEQGRE